MSHSAKTFPFSREPVLFCAPGMPMYFSFPQQTRSVLPFFCVVYLRSWGVLIILEALHGKIAHPPPPSDGLFFSSNFAPSMTTDTFLSLIAAIASVAQLPVSRVHSFSNFFPICPRRKSLARRRQPAQPPPPFLFFFFFFFFASLSEAWRRSSFLTGRQVGAILRLLWESPRAPPRGPKASQPAIGVAPPPCGFR